MSANGASEEKVTLLFTANMSAAMRRHYRRTKADAIDTGAMPFERILDKNLQTLESAMLSEDDGISGGESGPGDYEMLQRLIGVRGFLRYIKREGTTLPRVLKNLFSAGRAVQDAFFSSLTMGEAGLMFSETKAAHSFRCKLISGELKLAGAKGIRLPGQKSPETTPTYSRAQQGNHNRLGGTKAKQGSFLKKLKTDKVKGGHPPRQGSFLRQLAAKPNKKISGGEAVNGVKAPRPGKAAPVAQPPHLRAHQGHVSTVGKSAGHSATARKFSNPGSGKLAPSPTGSKPTSIAA